MTIVYFDAEDRKRKVLQKSITEWTTTTKKRVKELVKNIGGLIMCSRCFCVYHRTMWLEVRYHKDDIFCSWKGSSYEHTSFDNNDFTFQSLSTIFFHCLFFHDIEKNTRIFNFSLLIWYWLSLFGSFWTSLLWQGTALCYEPLIQFSISLSSFLRFVILVVLWWDE